MEILVIIYVPGNLLSIKILVMDNIRKSIDLLEERVEIFGWRKIRVNVFITDTLLPMLERMGAVFTAQSERPGSFLYKILEV